MRVRNHLLYIFLLFFLRQFHIPTKKKKKIMYSASIIEGKTNVFQFPQSIHHRRTRSLNAPSPFQQFGPCGRIMKNSAMVM